jgi:hypothetical protein
LNNPNYTLKDQVEHFCCSFLFFSTNAFLGIRQNHKKINEHNKKIGEKIQNLYNHQQVPPALPSPILARPPHEKQDVVVAPAQSSSRKLSRDNFKKQNISFVYF